MRRAVLSFLAPLILGLLPACDPGVTLHLVRTDSQPMTCPDNAEMTYTVIIQYKDGEQFVDSFDVDKKVNHPTIGMLEGSMERIISWVQVKLYCGADKSPVLVTPHIDPRTDLVKKDDRNYYYYVAWESAT